MSDRSDEVTASREPKSTDELLEETEQLLSGGSSVEDDSRGSPEPDVRGDRDSSGGSLNGITPGSIFDSSTESEPSATADESTRSRFGSVRSKLSPTRYFSPKAFLALVLVLGAGVLVGGTLVPLVGRVLGMFAGAFLVGLATAKRRYLVVTAAGTAVGAVAALFNYALFTLVGGGMLIAVGTTAGLVACLLGYYFGRDLRDGLQREI